MCVCVDVCVYMIMWVYVCGYECMHVCKCICVRVCVYVCAHISVCVYVCGRGCMHMCISICVYVWKEGNILFNNTFYLRLYGIRHMVNAHSDSERGNPLPQHGLLFPISSKGSFICTIPQTG